MNDKLKKFYDALVSEGKKLPDYNTFETTLQNQEKANKFYNALVKEGKKLPDFDTFYSTFQEKKSQQPTQQEPIQQEEPIGTTQGDSSDTQPKVQTSVFGFNQGIQQPKEGDVEKPVSPTIDALSGMMKQKKTDGGVVDSFADYLAIVNNRFYNFPADILDTYAITSSFLENQLNKVGIGKKTKKEDIWASKVADDWRGFVDEIAPINPELRESFSGQVVDGLAQVLPIMLTGGAGGVKELIKQTVTKGKSIAPYVQAGKDVVSRFGTPQGIVAGSQIAAPSYEQAINEGATEEEAISYALENFFVGSVMESLPVQSMFSRLSKLEPKARILDIIKQGSVGFGEEAITEMMQETYANMSAERIYDANRGMLDGVGEAGAVGGSVGFILNSMMGALTGRRARVNTPQEKEIIDKAITETEQKLKTVEENNNRIESSVKELDNKEVIKLNDGEKEIDFVTNEDGSVEVVNEFGSEAEANESINKLTGRYPNLDFEIVNNTDKSDPYTQANFVVRAKPGKQSVYKQGEETLEREELQSRIEEAESVEDLEGIGIENDTELEGQLKTKMDEVSEKSKQGLAESAQEAERVIPVTSEESAEVGDYFTREIDGETVVYEKGEESSRIIPENEYDRIEREETEQQPESEERVVVEDVQQEPSDQGVDSKVLVENRSDGIEVITRKDGSREVDFNKLTEKQKKTVYDNAIKTGEVDTDFDNFKQVFENEQVSEDLIPDTTKPQSNESKTKSPDNQDQVGKESEQLREEEVEELLALENEMEMLEELKEERDPFETSSLTKEKENPTDVYLVRLGDDGSVLEGYEPSESPSEIKGYNDFFYHKSGKNVVISDKQNGLKIVEAKTKKEALIKFKNILEKNGGVNAVKNIAKESIDQRKKQSQQVSDVTVNDSRPRVSFSVFGEQMTGTRDGDVIIGDDGTRYQPTMVESINEIDPENRIEKQKEAVKKALKDVKDKFNEGNQNAIIYDFKKVAENDIKFYNSLRNLVVEYARLKGMQFEQAIKELEKIANQTINKRSREYIKEVWDEVKKETPKRKIKDETIGLTDKEATKQGIEELLEDRRRKAQQKINQLRDEAKKKVKEARDKGKEKLDTFKNIRQTMADFIKMDLKDIPADSFTKSEVNKIITQIEKAKTDYSLNKAIEQVYGLLGEAGQRKRVNKAKNTQKTARRNVKSGKIGITPKDGQIDNILRIDPKIVPRGVFEQFESIVNQLGERKSVLKPKEKNQLISNINEVMQAVEEQNIKVEELSNLYDQTEKVQGTRKEDGKTVKYDSFSKTVDQMLKDGIINDDDAAIMRDRRNEIVEYTRDTETKTDEQLEEERQEAVSDAVEKAKNLPESNPLLTPDEKAVHKFYKSLTKEDLNKLSFEDVKRVNKILENLENNFVPHLAEKIRQKVSGQRSAKGLVPILSDFKNSFSNLWNFVSKTKAGIRNWKRPGSTSTMQEKIRRNPTIYIDQVLNNFKNTALYDATFRKLGQAYESYNNELQRLQSKLSVAERKLKRPFESRVKLTLIRLQEQFEANDGQNTAKEWIEATISDRNSIYDKVAKEELQKIFDQYSTDGEFDTAKAKKSMSKEESDAYDVLKEHFESLSPKADFTATVIRGNRVPIFENYHPVYRAVRGFEDSMELDKLKRVSNPSTKAGTLTDRTGKAHAISFDPFDTALLNAKEVLLDYNMTPSLNEINSSMDYLTSQAETDSQVEAVNSLRNVVNEMVENVIGVNFGMNNVADQIVNELVRKGYQATLGGIGRSMSELTSNTVFATMYKPNEFLNGVSLMMKNRGDISMLADVVNNSKSTQKTRLFDYGGMDSKHVDYSRNGNEMRKVLSPDSKTRKNLDKAGNYYRAVDRWAANVVSKPDQLVARPLWFGSYAQKFEAITGKKPDFKKIAENNESYMDQYGDAVDQATNFADDLMTEAVASSNPFDGILKSQISPSKAWITNFANTFNSYMTRFAIFEYNSAVRGIQSLTGNGMLTKTEGAKLLLALNARLAIYGLFTDTVVSSLYGGIVSMLGYDLEDEEEKEGVENVLAKELFSAVGMLAINRNLGNWAKIPTNLTMEYLNMKYGEGVTYKGDYDPYQNNITYPLVPLDGSAYGNLSEKIITGLLGPLSPLAKTGFNSINYATSAVTAAKPETRQRNLDKLLYKTTFELAGNLGFIPNYRDLRGIYNKIQYETKQDVINASDLEDDFDTSKLNFD